MNDVYLRAKKSGERAARLAAAMGQWPYLHSLEHILPEFRTLAKVSVGVMDIPLERIAGTLTEGRENAFACNYMPLLKEDSEFEMKWSVLAAAHKREGIRDPIIVYEYMNRFYVQEGNKRVSVLKAAGAWAVTADITRVLPKKTAEKEVAAYYEFLDFFRVTGLYDIVLTDTGAYAQLAVFYGRDCETPWPREDIWDIRSEFYTFQKIYRKKGGSHLRCTDGDAFLLYLRMYGRESLVSDGSGVIGRNIVLMWHELINEADEREAVLIEEESRPGRTPGLVKNIQKLVSLSGFSEDRPLRIAFLYGSDAGHSRWVYGHELGRNELSERYGSLVETAHYDNCTTEAALDDAFAQAAAADTHLVFTTTAAMMDASMRAAIRCPKLRILNCSINLSSSAVRTYYPRMHEAKFLLGALAAVYAQDHRIGYLADYPIYGSIAKINAFALGASFIDPSVRIVLKWSGLKGCDWEDEMRRENLRIISGPDMIRPEEAARTGARAYGVYETDESGRIRRLAAPIWNWGEYYSRIVSQVLEGSWNRREQVPSGRTVSYWYGLDSGVVDIIHAESLPCCTRKMLDWMKAGLTSGTLRPFAGELHSQSGLIREAGAPSLTSEQIICMDWLNDNVIGTIPAADEMADSVQAILKRSGVRRT